jgi:acetyl-CoA carboxylase beta subunit
METNTTKTTAAERGRYFVKCDECRETMRYTDSVYESACGAICPKCRAEINAKLAKDIDALQAAAARIARRSAKAGAR